MSGIRLSLIIPVLNSHEILRRQLLHLEREGLPDDSELILVDDGSDPPIENTSSLPVQILRTNDKRPWTWALARNLGARSARGDWLLMYDLDHIATRVLMEFVLTRDEVRVGFHREFGVLDERGILTQDYGVLESYGMLPGKTLRVDPHHNSFAMRKDLFWKLGGYDEDRVGKSYPQGEDSAFWKRWKAYRDEQGVEDCTGPTLFMFPTGRFCGDVDYNPHGLFHDLSRKSRRNFYWLQQRKKEGNAIR